MDQARNSRRFRTNPVEAAIFSVISLVFVNSVYNLFYEHDGFNPKAFSPMNSNPISEGRSPASSATKTLMTMEMPCDKVTSKDTEANKVRINGPLCGNEHGLSPTTLVKSVVTNNTNRFNATVFTDVASGKYSTDYIPLDSGENLIHLEFSYHSGKTIVQDVVLKRLLN